jgi:hypothetical protein
MVDEQQITLTNTLELIHLPSLIRIKYLQRHNLEALIGYATVGSNE